MTATPAEAVPLAAAWQQALLDHRQGRLQEAQRLYSAILKERPDHPDANHNLGILALQAGANQVAAACFERALAADPLNPQFWAALAKCRYAIGEWETATALLDKATAQGLDHAQFQPLRRAMAGDAATPGASKIFCVGRNKTGTTSLAAALASLGFTVGLQARGEALARDWAQRDFRRIFELCRTADAFQDVPFSRTDTYRVLDLQFPGSKFILTVRDSAEQWYESLTSFHTRIVDKGRLPTADDLKVFNYRYPGYLWESAQANYGIDETSLYDRTIYIAHYEDHNRQVVDHFKDRPRDLLVFNVAEAEAMSALCAFLGVEHDGRPMPHRNKTR
jgi:tetratricopeptide (TPR) repeat protein